MIALSARVYGDDCAEIIRAVFKAKHYFACKGGRGSIVKSDFGGNLGFD